MKIVIAGAKDKLLVIHKGQELDWKYTVWGTFKKAKVIAATSDTVFSATNDFLETLPEQVQDEIFRIYSLTHGVIHSTVRPDELARNTGKAISMIMEYIKWDQVVAWAKLHGNFRRDVSQANLTTNVTGMEDTTYQPQEVWDLTLLCVILKIFAPIVGKYIDVVKDEYGSNMKEYAVLAILNSPVLEALPPFQRLTRYVDGLARRKSEKISTALSHQMAVSILNRYLLALAITRRLLMAELRDPPPGVDPIQTTGLIQFVYKFLEDKLDQLKNGALKPKNDASGDGEEAESVADQFRIPAQIPAYVTVIANCYLYNIQKVAADIGLTVEEAEVANNIYLGLSSSEHFTITDIHLPIVALLLRRVMHSQTFRYIDRKAYLSAIAVAAASCYSRGYKDVYSLLTSVQVIKSIHETTLNLQNGRVFRPLEPMVAKELAEQYPCLREKWVKQKVNPGTTMIEGVVKIILSYDWEGMENCDNIRNSIAKLIINRNA